MIVGIHEGSIFLRGIIPVGVGDAGRRRAEATKGAMSFCRGPLVTLFFSFNSRATWRETALVDALVSGIGYRAYGKALRCSYLVKFNLLRWYSTLLGSNG